MTNEERRVHARVSLDHPCALHTPRGETYEGTLRQLSAAGAQILVSKEASLEAQSAVTLRPAPFEDAEAVSLRGRVVHIEPIEDGFRVGLELDELDKDQHERLQRFLGAALSGPGGGARQYPRINKRLQVRCETAAETRAVMCDLSQGGIGLESPDPLSVGDTVNVTVTLPGFSSTLQLTGTVVHTHELESGGYHAGLRFEELAPERRGVLRDLMQFLVSEGGER